MPGASRSTRLSWRRTSWTSRLPGNVTEYVEATEIIERRSDTDVTYVQRMNLPVLGRIQVQIHLADYGDRGGWHVIAWDQDEQGDAGPEQEAGIPNRL